MVARGSLLTNEQSVIELERKSSIETVTKSEFGHITSQTIFVLDGFMIYLTALGIFFSKHMTWEDFLGDLKSSA